MKIHWATGGGDRFNPDELIGELLAFFPLRVETLNSQQYGPFEATVCDVHIITGPRAKEVLTDVAVPQKKLQAEFRRWVGSGEPVPGRLGKGVAVKGQSQPWILERLDEAERAEVANYLATVEPPLLTSAEGPIGAGQLETGDEEPDLDGPGF